MLLARVKFKHTSRLRHLIRDDGKTLCGKTPTEITEIKPEFDGLNCSACYWNNRGLPIDQQFKYPEKRRPFYGDH